ncbi:unnamed protein product [Polarella glacialis]|uniref:Deacetylase sirtuin-type domain-containing protein n=1 Tax=Polarella glacialis TaxID=89957 RepID=A0A813F8T6_POLGL|nr:unnamed protein product [Polarella glacialis]
MSTVYLEHRDAHHVPGAGSSDEIEAGLQRAAEAIAACDALLFTAGAGMGVDSGLPDFRGTTGLWKDRDVAMTYEDMSDDKWFTEDPAFAWGVNYTQLAMYRKNASHAGYATLLKWANTLGKPYCVWTSNIDGMFQKAGFPNELVTTCHGDMHHLQCSVDSRKCKGLAEDRSDEVWSAEVIPDGLDEEIDPGSLRFIDAPSLDRPCFKCPRCGRLARPNVWFCGDMNYVVRQSTCKQRDGYNKWLWDLQGRQAKLVVIECGGGLAIPSVRIEGEDDVDSCGDGSLLVRFNPNDCKVPSSKGVGIPLGGMRGLALLDAALQKALTPKRSPTRSSLAAPKSKAAAARKPSPAPRKPSPAPP